MGRWKEVSQWLVSFNIALAIILVLTGVFAWRRVYSRTIADIQDRVIRALKGENETLTLQVQTLTKDVDRLHATIATMRYALRRQGIEIVIDDEFVTIQTRDVPKSTAMRIRREDVQKSVERRDRTEEEDQREPPHSTGREGLEL